MKVAVIIAKFPTGWRALNVGEDIAEVKAAFKSLKVQGTLTHQDEVAEVALFFDSAGNVRRKFLRTPAEIAALDSGRETFAAAENAKATKVREDAERAEVTHTARAIAEKAVDLVRSEIVAAATPAAPIAPAAPTPTPAPEPVADASETDSGDPEERFGGGKKTPKTHAKR